MTQPELSETEPLHISETARRPKVAVLLKVETDDSRTRHSLAQLAGGSNYDLHLLAHEEGWETDFDPVSKVAYALRTLREYGYPADAPPFLDHCPDAVLAVVRDRLPDYDWYVLVAREVLIRTPDYFDRLASRLRAPPDEAPDCLAPRLAPSPEDWFWNARAAERFETVVGAYATVLVLSRRALSHLVDQRLEEVRDKFEGAAEQGGATAKLIFGDAFVGSALAAGGYRLQDLNAFLPGSYDPASFGGPPRPLGGEDPGASPDLACPVEDDGVFLQDHLSFGWRTGGSGEFAAAVESRAWPVAEIVRREFADRVGVQRPGGSEGGAAAGGGRVAVLLRTHVDNQTVRASLAELAKGRNYDVFMLAHEEPGREMDFGTVPKLSHSLQTFRDLGFEAENSEFLMHFADLLFGFVQDRLPGYDWYVLVENDVLIHPAQPGYFDRLAERLARYPPGELDFVSTQMMFSHPKWGWYATAARTYPRVLNSFFPVVAASGRVIPYLTQERRDEQARLRAAGVPLGGVGPANPRIFCEAFIGSALWAGGYRVTDLNDVLPGSYTYEGFNVGPPRLLSAEGADGSALAHPVLYDDDFLEKHLAYSWRNGTLEAFLADLKRPAWPTIPPAVLQAFERRTVDSIAYRRRLETGEV